MRGFDLVVHFHQYILQSKLHIIILMKLLSRNHLFIKAIRTRCVILLQSLRLGASRRFSFRPPGPSNTTATERGASVRRSSSRRSTEPGRSFQTATGHETNDKKKKEKTFCVWILCSSTQDFKMWMGWNQVFWGRRPPEAKKCLLIRYPHCYYWL